MAKVQHVYDADGRKRLFKHRLLSVIAGVGDLWTLSPVGLDSTGRYVDRTTLASKDVGQFAVFRELTPPADRGGRGQARQ